MEIQLHGCKVFLADYGKSFDAARPAILFVHGAGMDGSVWPLQARHFAYRGWNALAVDLPGHGRSELPEDGGLASIEAMGSWLLRLIEELGPTNVRVVGHSMGALATLEAAAQGGEKLGGIALLGAAPAMPVHPALLEAAARPEPLAPSLICDWGFGPAGHFGGHRSPGSWMMGHALALLGRSAGPLLHADLAACDAYRGGLQAAGKIACPALVVAGDLDRMTPARQGAKLAEAIEGAHFVALPGCGHMMMIEQPDATLNALIDFFHFSPSSQE
jgi:pimeloyl-ACP methyl ester carboxylesterase